MTAATYFIADLHLDAQRPQATRAFVDLLAGPLRSAGALYILGDLFEAWLGDDDDSALARTVSTSLCALAANGVRVYFLRGNRDFLLGPEFATRCGMRLLPDPCVIDLHGHAALLMHGDQLCTADHGYQQFRRMVRTPQWQSEFLAQPLAARAAFASSARQASHLHQQALHETITDADPAAVFELLNRYGVNRLIHGHTHRPAIHALALTDRAGERIVLGDWYTQGSVLRIDDTGEAALDALRFA